LARPEETDAKTYGDEVRGVNDSPLNDSPPQFFQVLQEAHCGQF
jgi:hypothetical protein